MLNYALIKQIEEILLKIPTFSNHIVNESGAFYNCTTEYLSNFMKFAESNRLYIASGIGVKLDKLLLYTVSSNHNTDGIRQNIRKEKDKYAASILEEIHSLVCTFLEKDREKIQECEDILRQMIVRIPIKHPDIINNTNALDNVLHIMKNDSEMISYYIHVLGIMGKYNLKCCLDEVLTEFLNNS